MQGQHSILIDGNGNVTIRDASNGIVTIHTNNAKEILDELRQLNPAQIDTLLQVAPQLKEQLSEQFSSNLNNVAREKNVVKGSISNVGTVRIGDEIQYHYHHPHMKLPKELTLSIPKTHPDDIIGREEDLVELHGLLSNSKRVVMVNGLGGIGKTTLAQVYVSQYYEEYAHIAWITQSSDNIENDFINTAGLISNLQVQIANLRPEEIFGEIIRKLKAVEGKPNLLIIDNAEQSVQKYQHLLPGQPVWHVLLTSREDIEGFYVKPLGFLSEEQAITLFKKHYSRLKLHDQDIKCLVQSVDYHTLTIEILAKTAEVQRYDAATLKDAIVKDLRANVAVAHNRQISKIEKVGSYLHSIFSLSRLSDAEIWLLKQFTCLPSTFHHYELLYELIHDGESPHSDTFSETLTGLAKSGWLLYSKETDSYKMHLIIAEVVKIKHPISSSDIKRLIEVISDKLSIDQNKDNPVDKFVWIPFGKALIDVFTGDTANEIAVLQNNLAVVLQALGNYEGAKGLLEKAVLFHKKKFGAGDPSTATCYSNLALVLQVLGDYKSAKGLFQKALLSAKKNFGVAHPETAGAYSNLALALRNLKEYEGAKTLLQKAVLLYEKKFGAGHPLTVLSHSNLALVLQDLGEYEGAKGLFQKAVQFNEKYFGAVHPNTAASYSNLATVLENLGDYEGSKVLLQKAVLSYEKNFGSAHNDTAIIYTNLAIVLQNLGEYKEAKGLHQKALLSFEKNFGAGHPSTVQSCTNLAIVLGILGEYEGAKELLLKAALYNEKNFGAGHHITAISYSNLALVLRDLGEYKEAKVFLKKAVLSDEMNFGAAHLSITKDYLHLAMVHRVLEDYEGAKFLLQRLVLFNENNLGAAHPSTAISYTNLATVLQDLGEYDEALMLSAKALVIFNSALHEGHPHIEAVNSIYQSIKSKMV